MQHIKQTVEQEKRGLAEYINRSQEVVLKEVVKAGLIYVKETK